MPVGDYDYIRSGRVRRTNGTEANEADGINVDGSRNTRLVGRSYQEALYHNALAITDTANKDVAAPAGVDIAAISGRKTLMVFNTLNQPVIVSVLVKNASGATANAGSKTIPATSFGVVTAIDVPGLADAWASITVRAQCNTAPTGGSLTINLQGVQA